ncbi:sugar phosphate isomerase/epimerase [Halobacillus salinarum]|uniref:Sugar phosphate isomerase/epimerase n=1 Tax=Halobacillus salinarum TaxID=2932257 RepID=A0ABY4EJN4_9BACI|nr:sugar phosphate isomerase/epimerase family protein [Halobacillus salinarum]UOQ44180.1 sugar phosphate isomerase/epimerase [Halobacillus salinarum]
MKMKFGCCTEVANAPVVREAGFDFLECTVVSLMPEKEEEFESILRAYEESVLPVEVCNIFLPGSLKIVGESVDESAIQRYLEKAMPRVKQIGADTIVFGSGAARSLPENFSYEKGEEQIIRFLNTAADYAESLGLTIVIEPLNEKESNIMNTIPEAVGMAEKINRNSIQVLADFYHMEEEREALEHLVTYKNYIKHVHVADTNRRAPGTGKYPYNKFISCLDWSNYEGRISVECKWGEFEQEVKAAGEFLHDCFNKTKI